MKRITAIVALSLFLCSLSDAKDSLWGLGDNGRIAINFLEHRSEATSRVIDVTLILGNWFVAGRIREPNDARVEDTPISLSAKNASFEGTISVKFGSDKSEVKLKGKLTLGPSAFTLDESVDCKTIAGL